MNSVCQKSSEEKNEINKQEKMSPTSPQHNIPAKKTNMAEGDTQNYPSSGTGSAVTGTRAWISILSSEPKVLWDLLKKDMEKF